MTKSDHEYMDTGALTEDSIPEPPAEPAEPDEDGTPDTIVPDGVEINE